MVAQKYYRQTRERKGFPMRPIGGPTRGEVALEIARWVVGAALVIAVAVVYPEYLWLAVRILLIVADTFE